MMASNTDWWRSLKEFSVALQDFYLLFIVAWLPRRSEITHTPFPDLKVKIQDKTKWEFRFKKCYKKPSRRTNGNI